MRIALAQINSTLADFEANAAKILDFVAQAHARECELVIFPELTLMGYMPNDLLERKSVVDHQLKVFAQIQKSIPKGIGVLVGLVTKTGLKKGKPYFNSAALLEKGKKPRFFHKELLPAYDVFDEGRHMEKGSIADGFFSFKGRRFLLTICEDIWGWDLPGHPTNYLENPLALLKGAARGKKLDAVLNMSASPFTYAKANDRKTVISKTARHFKAPVIYVNMVGGQDEIIFDGGSLVVGANGKKLAQSTYFAEDLNIFDLDQQSGETRPEPKLALSRLREALVLGIRDYAQKTGFKKLHLGLSGGIDSSVVACLAVDAVGAENVTVFTLPGPFNEARSRKLAEQQAQNLGVRCVNFDIEPAYKSLMKTLHDGLGTFEFGVVDENVQSRVRGLLLMAFSNKENSMLLTTGNKCEYATGYATLYGDMCGGLAPVADLVKGEIYSLARFYNRDQEVIPEEIISRPPSAELRPNQKDEDSLPPYPQLDRAVQRMVEHQAAARNDLETWLLGVLRKTEFKRWQAPPVLKVSGHAFGRGRRMPLAHRAKK